MCLHVALLQKVMPPWSQSTSVFTQGGQVTAGIEDTRKYVELRIESFDLKLASQGCVYAPMQDLDYVLLPQQPSPIGLESTTSGRIYPPRRGPGPNCHAAHSIFEH
jgi:hypothetical protein